MVRSLLVFGIIQTIIAVITCGISLHYWKKYLTDRLELEKKEIFNNQDATRRKEFEKEYGKDILVVMTKNFSRIYPAAEYYNIVSSLIIVPRLPKPAAPILERIRLKQGFVLIQDYFALVSDPDIGVSAHTYCSTYYDRPEWHSHIVYFDNETIPITEIWSEEYLKAVEIGTEALEMLGYCNQGVVSERIAYNGMAPGYVDTSTKNSLTYNSIMRASIFAKKGETIPLINVAGDVE